MRFFPFYFITVLLWYVLYAPQAILPIFAEAYGRSESETALLVTATMFPLAVAPLLYGYLLESLSHLKVLRFSLGVLAVTSLLFGIANSFYIFVLLRFIQGLFLPAAITAIMAYISTNAAKDELSRAMSGYVTASVLGGMFARWTSGLVAENFDWRYYFFGLTIFLVGGVFHMGRVSGGVDLKRAKPTISQLKKVLFKPTTLSAVLAIFFVFMAFQGILNFIPFRIRELNPDASLSFLGFMYSGYIMGAVASLSAAWIVKRLYGELNAILIGIAIYGFSCFLLLIPNVWVAFGSMFSYCGAMFFIHSVSVGFVNSQESELRGVINGVYVSFYYSGGVVGSYVPGLIFENFGWTAHMMTLLGIIIIALMFTLFNKLRFTGKV